MSSLGGPPVATPAYGSAPGVNLQGMYNYGGQAGAYSGYGADYLNSNGYTQFNQPPGTGGVGGGVDPNALYQSFQNAMNSANAANESRYGQISSGYDTRKNDAMALLNSRSQQGQADIGRMYSERGAAAGQDMVSRGLTGTTVPQTIQTGILNEKQAALNRLSDQTNQEKLQYGSGMDLDKLQFMERRNDTGPSYAQLMQLASGLGGAAGGAGGGLSIGGGGGGAGYGKKSTGAGFGMTEPREVPQQGASESDAAFQDRYQKWYNYEKKNTPQNKQWYGQDPDKGPGIPGMPGGRDANNATNDARLNPGQPVVPPQAGGDWGGQTPSWGQPEEELAYIGPTPQNYESYNPNFNF